MVGRFGCAVMALCTYYYYYCVASVLVRREGERQAEIVACYI